MRYLIPDGHSCGLPKPELGTGTQGAYSRYPRMQERQIEAFLDTYARKLIADEIRVFYGSMEGDPPKHLLDVLKTLDGQTNVTLTQSRSKE